MVSGDLQVLQRPGPSTHRLAAVLHREVLPNTVLDGVGAMAGCAKVTVDALDQRVPTVSELAADGVYKLYSI